MRNRLIHTTLMTAASVMLFSPGLIKTSVAQVTWSPDLRLNSQADIPAAISAPLPDTSTGVTYTNGVADRTIKTCQDYLSSVSAGFYPKNNLDTRLAGSFVFRCYVLRDLQSAKPPTSGIPYQWTADSLSQLPPILVVGSKDVENAAEKAGQSGTSWLQYNPELKFASIKNDQLIAEDKENYYILTIVARGDFNGDGVADFAVVGTAKGKQTTWVNTKYFVFSHAANGSLVRLTSDKIPYQIKPEVPN
jgi:hypothetical protein